MTSEKKEPIQGSLDLYELRSTATQISADEWTVVVRVFAMNHVREIYETHAISTKSYDSAERAHAAMFAWAEYQARVGDFDARLQRELEAD